MFNSSTLSEIVYAALAISLNFLSVSELSQLDLADMEETGEYVEKFLALAASASTLLFGIWVLKDLELKQTRKDKE